MTLEELAQKFIDLYRDIGLEGISDEMTSEQLSLCNKYDETYFACEDLVAGK